MHRQGTLKFFRILWLYCYFLIPLQGCALAAAIISPTFKVRDFAVIDSFVYPVNLSWATHAAAVDAEAVEAGAADAAGEKKGDGDIFKQYGPLPVTYVTITAPVSQRLTRPLVGTSSPSLAANLSTSLQPTDRVCLPFH